MSARRRQRQRGAKVRPRVSSGLVDLSMVIDHAAVRRQNAASRAPSKKEIAVRAAAQEPLDYAQLCATWESADPGKLKRDALAALRAHELRHGRMPYKPCISVEDRIIDVSTGAESWLEVK
jgi:hypothetical protein